MSHCTVLSSPPILNTFAHPSCSPTPPSVGPLTLKTMLPLPPQTTSTASHGQIRPSRMPRPPSKAPTPWAWWSQLSAVPMSLMLAVLLVGMGPLLPCPLCIPPLTTMTTFLQHQHTVPRAVPTSPMVAATHPMSTTSVAATACLTAAAATTCSTAMAATTHSTAAAAGLKHPYDPATTPTTKALAHQCNAAAQHSRHHNHCSNLKTVRRSTSAKQNLSHSTYSILF